VTRDAPQFTEHRPQRPFGVTLIAIIQLLNALVLACSVYFDRSLLPDEWEDEITTSSLWFVEAVIGVVIAGGLWTLRRWAWTATMVWVGLNMAWSLHSYFEGDPPYATMAGSLVQVFYLNQREVQRAFERRRAQGVWEEQRGWR
jgi:hypothetical protein